MSSTGEVESIDEVIKDPRARFVEEKLSFTLALSRLSWTTT
jgi:hypothetical protein